MHHNGVALPTTNRLLDNDADLTEDFIHRLLLSAYLWILGLVTLARRLVRHVNLLTLVI